MGGAIGPTEPATRHLPRFRGEPFHVLVVVVAAYLILGTIGPIRDIDSYWHVRLGQEIWSQRSFSGPGLDWSFAVTNAEWRSTQWLTELAMAAVTEVLGWSGLVVFRGVATFALLAGIAFTVLRGVPARIGALVFTLTGVACVIGIQDRPMILGTLIMPFLALMWRRAVCQGAWPSGWILLPGTVVLANTHGLWIMIPAILGLAVLGRVADQGLGDPPSRRGLLLLLGTLAAGAASPLGISNLFAVFTFRSATELVNEWQPTTIDFPPVWGVLGLLALMVWSYARTPHLIPRSEAIYVLALWVFAFTAFRNVTTAALLLAPIVAGRLAMTWKAGPSRTGPREGAILAATCVIGVAGSAIVAMGSWWLVPALPEQGRLPLGIAERLAERGEPMRIFNDYNVAGSVLALAGPTVQVAVDGRSDYYGSQYIRDHIDTIKSVPGSFSTFTDLDPDAALISDRAPLADDLKERGWTVTDREGDWVLLEPPAS